jgi:hypothetical protein
MFGLPEKVEESQGVKIELLKGEVTTASGGSVVESHRISLSRFTNAEWYEDVFNRHLSQGHTYTLRMSAYGTTVSTAVAGTLTGKNIPQLDGCSYNGEVQKGVLLCDLRYAWPSSTAARTGVCLLIAASAALALLFIWKKDGRKTFKIERGLIDFVSAHPLPILFTAVTVLAFVMRLTMFDDVTWDYQGGYLEWYKQIKANGGLTEAVGDYTLPYQTFIYLLTLTNIPPLYGFKLFSVLFDYLMAASGAYFIYQICGSTDTRRGFKALAAYTFIIVCTCIKIIIFYYFFKIM